MAVCYLPWYDNVILYYIVIPETIVLGLMIYGIVQWLKAQKAIRQSPLASFFGEAQRVIDQEKKEHQKTLDPTPEEEGYLPPPEIPLETKAEGVH